MANRDLLKLLYFQPSQSYILPTVQLFMAHQWAYQAIFAKQVDERGRK